VTGQKAFELGNEIADLAEQKVRGRAPAEVAAVMQAAAIHLECRLFEAERGRQQLSWQKLSESLANLDQDL
jgi:hypothetical protein